MWKVDVNFLEFCICMIKDNFYTHCWLYNAVIEHVVKNKSCLLSEIIYSFFSKPHLAKWCLLDELSVWKSKTVVLLMYKWSTCILGEMLVAFLKFYLYSVNIRLENPYIFIFIYNCTHAHLSLCQVLQCNISLHSHQELMSDVEY